ncbi:MAG: PD40 domain-containing protein, partial [Paludibacteraceae bacterium]|nr:PD40 domain-containing protein [Paludibacteraceae bacterium]
MKYWKIFIMAAVTILGASCAKENTAEQKAPITKPQITIEGGRLTPEGLWAMGRIGSVKSDIETGLLAYTVSYYSVEENRSTTWIRIVNPFENMQVIDEFVGSEPAWFGNSGCLAYLKGGKLFIRRDKEEVEVEGAEDIEGFLLSPMRDKIILIKQVKTVQTTADQYPDLPLATGHMHEDLMYKHWDEWTETAPQPFVYELQTEYYGEGERMKSAKLGEGYNILEGTAFESPMKPFGGIEQLAWNPNNEEIAYTCRKKTGLDYAVSTNSDLYLYDLRTRTHKNITEDNKGYDTNPSYSPDGKWIAWQSMERDGYESDENRLMVMSFETGEKRFLSRAMDTNVDEYKWLDDTALVFTACKHATVQLYRVTLDGWTTKLTDGQWDLGLGDVTDYQAYLLGHSMRQANEIYHLDIREWLRKDHEQYAHTEIYYEQPFDTYNQPLEQLTHENDNIYSQIERSTVVPRWQKTTDGKDMLTWIIYPPHFDPAKKYPTILYC